MAASPKLTPDEIASRLGTLASGWKIESDDNGTDALAHRFEFTDFVAAMVFVNQLAQAAEAAQHHPDLDIRYNKVAVSLSTHDSGGITDKDFDLARQADAFVGAKPGV